MAVRSRKVKPFKRPKSKSEVDITPNVRRDILIALSNEASFLVEKRDKISTAHISTEEQHLIKLDGIFSVGPMIVDKSWLKQIYVPKDTKTKKNYTRNPNRDMVSSIIHL